ncbi:MAG: RNA polymerase sigma factor [Coprobacillaceae bacterium]
MNDMDLAQIVKRVQQDNSKFEELYPYIEKKVYFWCYTITRNKTDAEDATQESLLSIFKGLATLKNVEYFNSWMYRIVTRQCYTHLRNKKKRDNKISNYDDFAEDFVASISDNKRDSSPKEIYDLNELKEIVVSFINNLPRKQRETIILFYLEEFSINEISEILECNTANVRSRLHYGRKNLEQQILEYQDKNNIKLYNIPILTLLGTSIRNYQEKLYSEQKHEFNYNLNSPNKVVSLLQNLVTVLSYKTIILSILVCIIVVSAIILFQEKKIRKRKRHLM